MSRARLVAAAVALLLLLAGISGLDPAAVQSPGAQSSTGAAPYVGHLGDSAAVRSAQAHHRRGPKHPRPVSNQPPAHPLTDTKQRPNIVVIMTDDARDDDLRFMPNVRRLIGDQGVQFTNMFSPQPLCCPARASFLSGEYSHNHHVWSHVYPYGFRAFRDKSTLPVWLQRVGYNTAFLGKYLNGYGKQERRNGKPSLHYVPPGWNDWLGAVQGAGAANPALNGGTYHYFNTTLNENGRLVPHHGQYQTFLFSRISQRIFQHYAAEPKPFFYWASFVAPHHGLPREPDDPTPQVRSDGKLEHFKNPARPPYVKGRFNNVLTEPPGYRGEGNVQDKPFYISRLPKMDPAERAAVLEDARQRAEALSVLDDQVGAMMSTLRRTGALKNTYVVFTSDNGYFLGEHRMRQGKILPYEPSLRVPLLIRGPGIPAGQVRTDPASMTDFAPTFLRMAGAQPEKSVDGMSLLNIAKHGDRGWNRGILTETGPRAVIGDVGESDNFLVRGKEHALLHRKYGPSPLRFTQGVRTRNFLYTETASRQKELYDLRTDPGELHNLVHRRSERRNVRALALVLNRLRNCKGTAQCNRPMPPLLREP
jgi:arylsulfatase A-like enzyme